MVVDQVPSIRRMITNQLQSSRREVIEEVKVPSSKGIAIKEVKVPSSKEAPEKWPDNITSNVCELQTSIGATTKEAEVPSSREALQEWLNNINNLSIKKGSQRTNIESTIEDHEK